MSNSSGLITFNLKGETKFLIGRVKKKKEFYLEIQNASPNNLPRVKITLSGPPQINIWTKVEQIRGIASGKTKNCLFKVFPKKNGIFTLTATLEYKLGHLASLPIELRIGPVEEFLKPEVKQVQQPQLTVTSPKEEIASTMNCSYCGEEMEVDTKFCPICGSKASEPEYLEHKDNEIKCPNCGSPQPKGASFCGECGNKIQ